MAAAEPHWRALGSAQPAGHALSGLRLPQGSGSVISALMPACRRSSSPVSIPRASLCSSGRSACISVGRPACRRVHGRQARQFQHGAVAPRCRGRDRRQSNCAPCWRKSGDRADLMMLANQPLRWSGLDNPFALLPHQASPSFGYSGALQADFDALLGTARQFAGAPQDAPEGDANSPASARCASRKPTGDADIKRRARRFLQTEDRAHARHRPARCVRRRPTCAASSPTRR